MEQIIGPYPSKPDVAFHEYDPRAADVAARLADLIVDQLPDVTVEHVGSTAVPGCGGKGVVDLMVLYPPGGLDAVKDRLDALGFQHQTSGHPWPEDRPMRVGTLQHEGTVFRVHAHVIAAASDEAAQLRAFRDRLRADPGLVEAYVTRKREILAAGIDEPRVYTELKGGFIRDVHDQG